MYKIIDKFIDKIIQNDNIEVLKEFPSNSVDLVITSPPYDKLRDYKG
jgi:site-specific DNA-methyltransferase (adenine-specific)